MAADKSNWVVGKVLAQQARERGDKPFMQFEDGEPYTYAQAHDISNCVGNAFAQEGGGDVRRERGSDVVQPHGAPLGVVRVESDRRRARRHQHRLQRAVSPSMWLAT